MSHWFNWCAATGGSIHDWNKAGRPGPSPLAVLERFPQFRAMTERSDALRDAAMARGDSPQQPKTLADGLGGYLAPTGAEMERHMLTTAEQTVARILGKSESWMLAAKSEEAKSATPDGRGAIIDDGTPETRNNGNTLASQIRER